MGPDDRRGLFQQRRRLPHRGEAFDAGEQPFLEALGGACVQLEVRGPDHRVDHFPPGARDASAG